MKFYLEINEHCIEAHQRTFLLVMDQTQVENSRKVEQVLFQGLLFFHGASSHKLGVLSGKAVFGKHLKSLSIPQHQKKAQ